MADITMPGTATAAVPTPAAQNGAFYFDTTTLRFTMKDSSAALTTFGPFGNATTTAASGAINTAETIISPTFAIPAGTFKVGSSYRIRIFGTCTSTAANLSTFTVRYGAAGTTADASMGTVTCTAATSGTTIAFCVEILVTVRAIGASGTLIVVGIITNQGITGISSAAQAVVVVNAQTTSVNTLAAGFLSVSYKSAVSTTTSTIQSVVIEQIKD